MVDIIVIAICAVICGADNGVAVEMFGNAKRKWLEHYLELPNGIPSHDTFGRVFARPDPDQFQQSFRNQVTNGEVAAIDGKTLRRSHDKTLGKEAIHRVSAWASANQVVLGPLKTDEGSNEITAIPKLLEVLASEGRLVTIDAMGCQKQIAATIAGQGFGKVMAPRILPYCGISRSICANEKPLPKAASRPSASRPPEMRTIYSKSCLDKMRFALP